MTSFWSWFVIAFTVANILACVWLIRWTAKPRENEVAETDTLDQVWDGDLREYNNPMPYWWLMLFYITIVFGLLYLVFYPGLGNFAGILGWTQSDQYQEEVAQADKRYGPIFGQYAYLSIEDIAKDAKAVELGRNLFGNNCAACHGSDARGVPGFPNLADDDWLYGGAAETVYTSILNGRSGLMPPMGASVDDATLASLVRYVRSLSGLEPDDAQSEAGKTTFDTLCAACHGVAGTGNPLLGAPNLTDDIWLHGSSEARIGQNVRQGLEGAMPAHRDLLGEDKVRVLAAYVYSLSNKSTGE